LSIIIPFFAISKYHYNILWLVEGYFECVLKKIM
jgi:hypothetical protein